MNSKQKIGWNLPAGLPAPAYRQAGQEGRQERQRLVKFQKKQMPNSKKMTGWGLRVCSSLGFQLADIQNTWSIVLIWVLGGVFALIGAFTYAELGTNFD